LIARLSFDAQVASNLRSSSALKNAFQSTSPVPTVTFRAPSAGHFGFRGVFEVTLLEPRAEHA